MTLQWRSVRTRGAVFVSFWSENWICICSVDACLCVNVVNVCKYRLPYIHSKKCFWKEECQNLLPTYISTFNILEISQLQTMTVLNQALYELLEHEFTNLYCKDYRKRVLWLILIVVVVSCCPIFDDSPLLWPNPIVFLLLWNSTL